MTVNVCLVRRYFGYRLSTDEELISNSAAWWRFPNYGAGSWRVSQPANWLCYVTLCFSFCCWHPLSAERLGGGGRRWDLPPGHPSSMPYVCGRPQTAALCGGPISRLSILTKYLQNEFANSQEQKTLKSIVLPCHTRRQDVTCRHVAG
jgi:hypothetical protein